MDAEKRMIYFSKDNALVYVYSNVKLKEMPNVRNDSVLMGTNEESLWKRQTYMTH